MCQSGVIPRGASYFSEEKGRRVGEELCEGKAWRWRGQILGCKVKNTWKKCLTQGSLKSSVRQSLFGHCLSGECICLLCHLSDFITASQWWLFRHLQTVSAVSTLPLFSIQVPLRSLLLFPSSERRGMLYLGLKCSQSKVHWSPAWCYWDMVEPLSNGTY